MFDTDTEKSIVLAFLASLTHADSPRCNACTLSLFALFGIVAVL